MEGAMASSGPVSLAACGWIKGLTFSAGMSLLPAPERQSFLRHIRLQFLLVNRKRHAQEITSCEMYTPTYNQANK
jgi:hypothetical protein